MRLVEGAEKQNRCNQSHVWWLRIRKDVLAAEVTFEEQGVPALTSVLQLRAQMLGRRALTTFSCENQQEFCPPW